MARPLPANLVNLIGDRAHLANLALPSRTTTSTPIHPIHENIKLGKLDKIMEIIQSEPTAIDCRNKMGVTPLQVACSKSFPAIVKYLIDQGANVNTRDNIARTAMHWAVMSMRPNEDIITMLLSAGADIEAQDMEGLTPLHLVATMGDINIAEQLLSAGANHSSRNNHQRTPLHCACEGDKTELALVLIKHGADIDEPDRYGYPPLHFCIGGDAAIMQLKEAANGMCAVFMK